MTSPTRLLVDSLKGRELNASELKGGTIVRVVRQSTPLGITAVILTAGDRIIHFRETETGNEFLALRTGPGLEKLIDNRHRKVKIFVNTGAVKYAASH